MSFAAFSLIIALLIATLSPRAYARFFGVTGQRTMSKEARAEAWIKNHASGLRVRDD